MSDPGAEAASLDRAQLLAEIHQEVERRRASGDLPPDLERELDRAFAELAPVDVADADFDSIVTKIERAAVIDLQPPTVSAYPGAAQMKQVVAKATAFYLRHVATQASGLFQGVARALRLLGDRVDALEAHSGADAAGWRELVGLGDLHATSKVTEAFEEFVLGQLGAPSGRVLHVAAGDGRLVRRLVDAGHDAYGVEPCEEAALAASDLVADIRAAEPVDHLETLPPASLGSLVLSGFIEHLDLQSLTELIGLAASRLAAGGALIVLSAHPNVWSRCGSPLMVDLAPGRPLHPETWQLLVRRAGFVGLTTQLGSPPRLAFVSSESSPEWAAANANFARLAEAVFGPADFAVSAFLSR